jgi:hypothetical protein
VGITEFEYIGPGSKVILVTVVLLPPTSFRHFLGMMVFAVSVLWEGWESVSLVKRPTGHSTNENSLIVVDAVALKALKALETRKRNGTFCLLSQICAISL